MIAKLKRWLFARRRRFYTARVVAVPTEPNVPLGFEFNTPHHHLAVAFIQLTAKGLQSSL